MTEMEAREKLDDARTLLNEVVQGHEDNEHDGKCCVKFRASVVAFVAHDLGMPSHNDRNRSSPTSLGRGNSRTALRRGLSVWRRLASNGTTSTPMRAPSPL
jgi:hypothetical protein